jgi:hypothetical protein
VQSPEAFLAKLEISLPGIVVPEQPALVEPASRTIVNGHFFWVSSSEKLEAFRAAPQRFTGPLIDPITHEWFTPSDESPRRDTREGILLFSGTDSAREFDDARDPFPGHGH